MVSGRSIGLCATLAMAAIVVLGTSQARDCGGDGPAHTATVAKWMVSPDFTFAETCPIVVRYGVVNAKPETRIELKVNDRIVNANERTLDCAYDANSEVFGRGTPGPYNVALYVDGTLRCNHSVFILKSPVSAIPYTAIYRKPEGLMDGNTMSMTIPFSELTVDGVFLPDDKNMAPICVCQKGVLLKGFSFLGETGVGWSHKDEIMVRAQFGDGSFRDIGKVTLGRYVEAVPAIPIEPGFKLYLSILRNPPEPSFNDTTQLVFNFEVVVQTQM